MTFNEQWNGEKSANSPKATSTSLPWFVNPRFVALRQISGVIKVRSFSVNLSAISVACNFHSHCNHCARFQQGLNPLFHCTAACRTSYVCAYTPKRCGNNLITRIMSRMLIRRIRPCEICKKLYLSRVTTFLSNSYIISRHTKFIFPRYCQQP